MAWDSLQNFFITYKLIANAVGSAIVHNLEAAVGGVISFAGFEVSAIIDGLSFLYLWAIGISSLIAIIIAWRYSRRTLFPFTVSLIFLPGMLGALYPKYVASALAIENVYTMWGGLHTRSMGSIGEVWASVCLFFIVGWAMTSFFSEILMAGKRFRLIYDHAWTTIGLFAILFLFFEVSATKVREDLAETDAKVVKALSILSEQSAMAESICNGEAVASNIAFRPSAEFCDLVSGLNYRVNSLKGSDIFIRTGIIFPKFEEIMPKANTQIFSKTSKALKEEIGNLNSAMCNADAKKFHCTPLPEVLAVSLIERGIEKSPDILDRPFSIAVPELVSLLNAETTIGRTMVEARRHDAGLTNKRFLFFLIVSFLAGGKVAMATREIYRKDDGSRRVGDEWGDPIHIKFSKTLSRPILTALSLLRNRRADTTTDDNAASREITSTPGPYFDDPVERTRFHEAGHVVSLWALFAIVSDRTVATHLLESNGEMTTGGWANISGIELTPYDTDTYTKLIAVFLAGKEAVAKAVQDSHIPSLVGQHFEEIEDGDFGYRGNWPSNPHPRADSDWVGYYSTISEALIRTMVVDQFLHQTSEQIVAEARELSRNTINEHWDQVMAIVQGLRNHGGVLSKQQIRSCLLDEPV